MREIRTSGLMRGSNGTGASRPLLSTLLHSVVRRVFYYGLHGEHGFGKALLRFLVRSISFFILCIRCILWLEEFKPRIARNARIGKGAVALFGADLILSLFCVFGALSGWKSLNHGLHGEHGMGKALLRFEMRFVQLFTLCIRCILWLEEFKPRIARKARIGEGRAWSASPRRLIRRMAGCERGRERIASGGRGWSGRTEPDPALPVVDAR